MASGILALAADLVFEGKSFRIFRNGEPWFVLADVCEAVEINNPRDVAARLDDDEKGVANVDTLGGPQQMTIISEPGLYAVLRSSRKPAAKRLDRLVRHEILPSIRKHGCYPPPATNVAPPEMAFLNQMFDEFGKKQDRKFEDLSSKVDNLDRKLTVVVDNTNKGRKYATVETVRTQWKVICHHFFMLCPCELNCGTKIADENGFIKDAWEHHHQFGPWDNSSEAMIPLAIECHQRITNDRKSRRLFDQTAFPQFQNLLARMPVTQLTLNL